jgi:hypothetical protein
MVKVILRSINNQTFEVNINPEDKVEVLVDELIKAGKMVSKDEQVAKFIKSGIVLDNNASFVTYHPTDGMTIVYMITKKKPAPPVEQVVTETLPAPATVLTTPVQNNNQTNLVEPSVPDATPLVNPLPDSFAGVSVGMLRQMTIGIVLNHVLSNKELFKEVLLSIPQVQQLRAVSPDDFDALISHPEFIPNGAMVDAAGMGGMGGGFDGVGGGDYNDDENEDNVIDALSNQLTSQLNIDLTHEDQEFLKTIVQNGVMMGVDVNPAEAMQIYVACGKDKDLTISMLFNS